MKMTQLEIVQAILDKKSLDYLNKDGIWEGWCTDGGWDHERTPPTLLFSTLAVLFQYKADQFRIRPKTKTYQSRAYIVGEKNVFHWVSTSTSDPQADALKMYGGQARWIEETQTKEYEVPV